MTHKARSQKKKTDIEGDLVFSSDDYAAKGILEPPHRQPEKQKKPGLHEYAIPGHRRKNSLPKWKTVFVAKLVL